MDEMELIERLLRAGFDVTVERTGAAELPRAMSFRLVEGIPNAVSMVSNDRIDAVDMGFALAWLHERAAMFERRMKAKEEMENG